jgi:hypothetical protein
MEQVSLFITEGERLATTLWYQAEAFKQATVQSGIFDRLQADPAFS